MLVVSSGPSEQAGASCHAQVAFFRDLLLWETQTQRHVSAFRPRHLTLLASRFSHIYDWLCGFVTLASQLSFGARFRPFRTRRVHHMKPPSPLAHPKTSAKVME